MDTKKLVEIASGEIKKEKECELVSFVKERMSTIQSKLQRASVLVEEAKKIEDDLKKIEAGDLTPYKDGRGYGLGDTLDSESIGTAINSFSSGCWTIKSSGTC